jgi:hypothetical protein
MQLVIDIPEWAQERHIYVMAGMELLAYLPYQGQVQVKTVRCNNCGWCCENPPKGAVPQGHDGACIYLETIGSAKECSLGLSRPWHCCWPDPHLTKHPEADKHCCIRYEVVE